MRHFTGSSRGKSEDTVTVTAVAIRQSAKALLVRVGDKEAWIPQSVIHDDSEVFDKTHTTPAKLVVHGWWARKEGLG